MKITKEFKVSFLLVSLCYIVLGVVILIYPALTLRTVCYALGGITLLYGVLRLITYFARRDFEDIYQLDFVSGVLLLAAGVFVIAKPDFVATMLPLVVGLAIVLDSLIKLQNALDLARMHASVWWLVLVLAVLTGALGALLIWNPAFIAQILTQFVGITLIVDGAVNLWSLTYLGVKLKQLRKRLTQELQAEEAIDVTPKEPAEPAPKPAEPAAKPAEPVPAAETAPAPAEQTAPELALSDTPAEDSGAPQA